MPHKRLPIEVCPHVSDEVSSATATRDVTAALLAPVATGELTSDEAPEYQYGAVESCVEASDYGSTDVEGQSTLAAGGQVSSAKSPWGMLSVLLLGVFVAQMDQSLVLATYGQVASDFRRLDLGFWIISAYVIAQCAVQPLYGKLSDIYSRKSCLLTAYVLFAAGTAGAGFSRNMGEIIAWRAIQGAGGSGMVSVVSIIITDMVPQRNIATVRSYVNVLQTTGRSCGGVIGGLLAQAVGWRWAFLVQVPPTIGAIILVAYALKVQRPIATGDTIRQNRWERLRRVDFMGAFFLFSFIISVCLILDLGGQSLPWSSPYIFALIGSGTLTGIGFVATARRVREPILPLRLLTQWTVLSNCAVVLLSVMAQMSLMTAVPIYFQTTSHASAARAGAYLIPAFAGNTLGGLTTGFWIKRTGRYKFTTIAATLSSIFCMILLLVTWKGNTSTAQALFIFPGGFAMGIAYASTFVGTVAGVAKDDVAVSSSSLYLFFNLGAIAAVSAGNSASQMTIRRVLESSLSNSPNKEEIIQNATTDLEYIWRLKNKQLRAILISAYAQGFNAVNSTNSVLGLGCSSLAFLVACFSKGTYLEGSNK